MKWNGKKVLVTGAAGFIGSHLTEKLVSLGANVRAFDLYNSRNSCGWLDHSVVKNDVAIMLGDVCDRDSIRKAMKGMEFVFHLAALIAIPYSYESPLSYIRTNVEGTFNALQSAREEGVGRFVHTSTSEVYGTARRVPIDEDHPLQGQSPYSASKIGADKIAEAFHKSFGLPVATVRPFNTYGPRQSARAVIPTIVTQSLMHQQIRLGSLHPTRDLNYVMDTVDGFIKVAESDRAVGEVINIGSGQEISIGNLVQMIQKILGRDCVVHQDHARIRPPDSEVERLCCSNQKAATLVGWKPKIALEEGLKQTIGWIQDHLHEYKINDYTL